MNFKKNFHPSDYRGVFNSTVYSRVSDGKHSSVKLVPSSVAYPPLPPSSNFTLDAQLRAGVPLTEVNSQLLDTPQSQVNSLLNDFIEDVDKLETIES